MLVRTHEEYAVTLPAAPWEKGTPAKAYRPPTARRRAGGVAQGTCINGVVYKSKREAAEALKADRKTLDKALRDPVAMAGILERLKEKQNAAS